ncbi:protein BPS1, chloroplastic-like [Apium graveolens]|uniref:protein BPS1, chloroplastic-like n=1 Tax=Apium graveolens TaxID=4045 RepID=UPI003D7936DE
MSRPREPQRPLFPFGNPFRMILPKGSYLSPGLLALLNNFEEALAERLRKLKPTNREDVLTLSWMRYAMDSLCAIHTDIKTLITALELPVSDWDDKWIDVYLDNSVKMLDICIGFSAELSRLKQGHLFLQCVMRNMDSMSSNQFIRARSSLDDWKHHITVKNSRIENCFTILDNLAATLNEPKVKNSSKGKVLMRAMYGVKVFTVFVCGIFAAAFSGSSKKLMDLHVPEKYLWAEAFTGLQAFVNGEIRNLYSSGGVTVLKELQAVDVVVKKLYPLVEDGSNSVEAEEFKDCILDLGRSAANLSEGLDILLKEVDGFFQILLTGRDALLCNLRTGTDVSSPVQTNSNLEQFVR